MNPDLRYPRLIGAIPALLILCTSAATALAGPVTGVGIMGDSVPDEFRWPQILPPGGHRSAERNFVEVLAATRGLDFGTYSYDSRGVPRHQGFEYNWALDGSTSSDLISNGQHTGLAEQVAAGKVNLAWMFIGGNDFRVLFSQDVIQSPDPGAAIQSTVVTLLTNVQTAVQTILAANPEVGVVVANVPDLRSLPGIKAAVAAMPEIAPFVAAVDQGIQAYNAQLAGFDAASDRVALLDAYGISQAAVSGAPVEIGGMTLDTNIPGYGPTHYFIDVIHPGTVASGVLADAFVSASNSAFASGIQPLSQQEIIAYANAIPLPAPLYAGLVGLTGAGMSVLRARRRRAG